MDSLRELQAWYAGECDGDWEHSYGIKLDTLDNPGWLLTVDLAETDLENRPFEELRDNYDHETDWLLCRRGDAKFEGSCGPLRLESMIRTFLDWAKAPAGDH